MFICYSYCFGCVGVEHSFKASNVIFIWSTGCCTEHQRVITVFIGAREVFGQEHSSKGVKPLFTAC